MSAALLPWVLPAITGGILEDHGSLEMPHCTAVQRSSRMFFCSSPCLFHPLPSSDHSLFPLVSPGASCTLGPEVTPNTIHLRGVPPRNRPGTQTSRVGVRGVVRLILDHLISPLLLSLPKRMTEGA